MLLCVTMYRKVYLKDGKEGGRSRCKRICSSIVYSGDSDNIKLGPVTQLVLGNVIFVSDLYSYMPSTPQLVSGQCT